MQPPDRVEWVSGVDMHEVAEALGVDTVDVMAVHSDGMALFTTETLTAEDPPIWRARLARDADGIVVAGPREFVCSTEQFKREMNALLRRAEGVE